MDDYGSPHLEISINLSADLSVPCQKAVRNVLPLSSSIYLFIYFSGAHMFKIFSCHNVVKNETCLFLMLMISCLCIFQNIYITYFGIQSIFKDQSHLRGMMGYFLLTYMWAWWQWWENLWNIVIDIRTQHPVTPSILISALFLPANDGRCRC